MTTFWPPLKKRGECEENDSPRFLLAFATIRGEYLNLTTLILLAFSSLFSSLIESKTSRFTGLAAIILLTFKTEENNAFLPSSGGIVQVQRSLFLLRFSGLLRGGFSSVLAPPKGGSQYIPRSGENPAHSDEALPGKSNLMNADTYQNQPYMKTLAELQRRMAEAGRPMNPAYYEIAIAHDDDCPASLGDGLCRCDADVTIRKGGPEGETVGEYRAGAFTVPGETPTGGEQ